MTQSSDDSIRLVRTVPLPAPQAFALFAERFGSWYPSVYSWSGDLLEYIGMEAEEGGRCYEVGPHGFSCDWGRVLEWQPPRLLRLTWQISFTRAPVPDPAACSEIEVAWEPREERSSQMVFQHRHFARHGEGWREYLAAMASEGGWPFILDRYLEAAANPGLQPS